MEGKKVDLLGSSSSVSDCELDDCAREMNLLKTWCGIIKDHRQLSQGVGMTTLADP